MITLDLFQPQLRGPLPLRFHLRNGRTRVIASTDCSTSQNPAPWCAKVERVLPYPEPRIEMASWASSEGNTTVPVAVYPSGAEYAIRPDGALVRLGVRK